MKQRSMLIILTYISFVLPIHASEQNQSSNKFTFQWQAIGSNKQDLFNPDYAVNNIQRTIAHTALKAMELLVQQYDAILSLDDGEPVFTMNLQTIARETAQNRFAFEGIYSINEHILKHINPQEDKHYLSLKEDIVGIAITTLKTMEYLALQHASSLMPKNGVPVLNINLALLAKKEKNH